MAKTKGNGRGSLRIYKSYNFVDKDPAVDVVRTIVQKAKKSYKEIQDGGGPTISTLHGWFDGKIRRPQHATMMAAVRAVGGDIVYRGHDGTEYTVKGRRS